MVILKKSLKTAQIEGNTYDFLETEILLTQNIEAKGHTKEEAIMLINHKKAFAAILKNKKGFTNISLSDLVQLHGVLTKNLTTSGIQNQPIRIARTLANAILLAHDFFPLSYRNVDVDKYRKALILFYERNNLYYIKKMFMEQLDYALNNYFNLV